jgi:thiol-disulfide isomerase/thioredoxin
MQGGRKPAKDFVGDYSPRHAGKSYETAKRTIASWCGPSQRLSLMWAELAGMLTNQIKFVKINAAEAFQLAQRLEFQGVPTLIFSSTARSRMVCADCLRPIH